MQREIELPDGTVLEFPDGTSDDVVRAAIQRRMTQAPSSAPEEPRSVGGFVGNVLSSGWNAAAGLVNSLGEATKQKGQRRLEQDVFGGNDPELRQPAPTVGQRLGAFKDYAGERYGGLDAIGNTLYNDPVGAGADLSALLGSGAFAASKMGTTGAKVASMLRKADPAVRASELVGSAGRAVGASAQSRGQQLMQTALKMNERQKIDTPQMPQTALDYGINRSSGGRKKLDSLMKPLKEQKGTLVDESPLTFDPQDPMNFPQSRDQMALAEFESSVAPEAVKQSEQVLRDFQAAPKYQGDAPISFASKDKTRIYKGLGDNAYANAIDQKPRGSVDMQKALASDLRAIEEQVPGVAGLNAELSPMYDLRTHLVKTLGPGGAGFPYPSGGGVTRTIGSAMLPYAESVGARGVFQAGRGIASGANAAQQAGPTIARLSALERALMGRR